MGRLIFFLIIISMVPNLALGEAAPYKDECAIVKTGGYCKNIGKQAYLKGDKKKAILGKIIAITWKEKGDPIEINPNLTAIEDGFYYVIDTDGNPERQIVVLSNLIRVIK